MALPSPYQAKEELLSPGYERASSIAYQPLCKEHGPNTK